MKTVPEADVAAAIEGVTPVELIDANQQSFDYLRLSDEQFELLLCALARSSAPEGLDHSWDAATLMVRGADAGRDVLLTRAGRACGVVQCKRLESSMPLPAVFREIAKLVLYATVGKDLSLERGLIYVLAVARDPARTVVEHFARRAELEPASGLAIRAAAREVRDSYATLKDLTDDEAEGAVLAALPHLTLHLVRPADLDEWLGREAGVSRRFFRQRTVVDNEPVQEQLAQVLDMLGKLSGQVSNIEPITDEDLAILRDDISDTPETHRLHLGICMLFGFPREMFAGRPALEARFGRLAKLLMEIDKDYTDWTFAQARRLGDDVLASAEAKWIAPFALQLPQPFLGLVAKECLVAAISGSVMDGIIRNLSGEASHQSDDDRLQAIRGELRASGLRYLAGDYSELVGDAEMISLKRAIISELMRNIERPEHIGSALDHGIAILKPKLIAAADDLRRLCKHRTTIVLTGTRGIDTDASLKRLVDTVRAIDGGGGIQGMPAPSGGSAPRRPDVEGPVDS